MFDRVPNTPLMYILYYSAEHTTVQGGMLCTLARYTFEICCVIFYYLYNLKKREKRVWRSVTFSKVADLN